MLQLELNKKQNKSKESNLAQIKTLYSIRDKNNSNFLQ